MILGWDIGGANTKAVAVERSGAGGIAYRDASIPLDIGDDPRELRSALRSLSDRLGEAEAHAVTMTAELARAFRTKRDGVAYVLDAFDEAVPGARAATWVYTTDGRFVTPAEARTRPLAVGAANWMATAALVAQTVPDCLLLDTGSTSTDIIPIVAGRVTATGRTDPERLLSGELVYTGALRTPAEALVSRIPLWGGRARVAAERFATTGDAHRWLGRLSAADYAALWPGGPPGSSIDRELAAERLARLVCADREMLDDAAIDMIAHTIADAQIAVLVDGIAQVRAHHPGTGAVVTGLGDFIAADAARAAGLAVSHLSDRLGPAARVAAAAAVATLFAELTCRS